MNRSGYCYDECDSQEGQWARIRWRGAVKSAIRGKRGQALLKDLVKGLDAMEDKKLITDKLEHEGCYCALGVVGKVRDMPLDGIDPDNSFTVANKFDIADALAREVVFINDENGWHDETGEQRWQRVRNWAARLIKQQETA